MKRGAFALALVCLTCGCGAATKPTPTRSGTAPITIEIAPPPLEKAHALANPDGTECPDHFWRAPAGCLPDAMSETDAVSEREFYGEVEARVAGEFNSAYGGSFLPSFYPSVLGKDVAAHKHTSRLSDELEFFVRHCRAPDVVIRALVQQQAMFDRLRAELSQVSPLPNPNANQGPAFQQPSTRLAQLWAQSREHSLKSDARTILSLRQDAFTIAEQYSVSGISLPPPAEKRSDTSVSKPALSWDPATRAGCSREARAELVRRRELERSEQLKSLAALVIKVLQLKP